MTNQFRALGVATGANVLTPDQWAALGARQQGFVTGTARSVQLNTAWRQSTSWAEVLGEFVNDRGFNALDDGNLDNLQTNYEAALRAYIGLVIPDSALWHYGQVGGSASALIVSSTTPALRTPYVTGSTVLIKMPSGFGAAPGATIKFGAGPAVGLFRNNATPIVKGDLPPGSWTVVFFDGTNFRLLGPGWAEFAPAAGPQTLYVSPAGDDNTDDGTTPATAFRQIRAAALASVSRFPLSVVTIVIDDGGYNAIGSIPSIGGTLILVGNEASPANVLVSGTAAAGRGTNEFSAGTIVARGITFQNTGTTAHTVAISSGNLTLFNSRLVSTTNNVGYYHLYSNLGASISVRDGNSAQGNMAGLFGASGGNISIGSISAAVPFTIIGSPTYATATAVATNLGTIGLLPGVTFPGGSVTGPRYRVEDNSVINASGNGENAFPGSTAGLKFDNGVYKP